MLLALLCREISPATSSELQVKPKKAAMKRRKAEVQLEVCRTPYGAVPTASCFSDSASCVQECCVASMRVTIAIGQCYLERHMHMSMSMQEVLVFLVLSFAALCCVEQNAHRARAHNCHYDLLLCTPASASMHKHTCVTHFLHTAYQTSCVERGICEC